MTLTAGCPVGCGRRVAAGQLLCRPCWARVPRAEQRAVNATWRTYRRALEVASPDDRATERAAYQAARNAAIEWAGR